MEKYHKLINEVYKITVSFAVRNQHLLSKINKLHNYNF